LGKFIVLLVSNLLHVYLCVMLHVITCYMLHVFTRYMERLVQLALGFMVNCRDSAKKNLTNF
jgi:hypothetical protein